MKMAWLTSLRGLYPNHEVYLMGGAGCVHSFRVIEPEPVEERPRCFVDFSLSDELLDAVSQGNRDAAEFVIEIVTKSKAARFPAPENDPR